MTKSKKGNSKEKNVPSPHLHSLYPNTLLRAHPPGPPFTLRLVWLAFDQCLLSLPEGWSLGGPGTGGRAWFMHQCFLWMDPELEWTQALCVWHNGLWQQVQTNRLSGTGQALKKRQFEGGWGKSDNCTGDCRYVLSAIYWIRLREPDWV